MTSEHTRQTGRGLWRARTAAALAGWLALGPALPRLAFAGAENPVVVRGDVSIETVGDTTRIHASDRSIINYTGLDVARHETLQFIQPSESASVLNRIQSSRPTLIEGALLANGRVYMVNPAGVYFAQGATVDVGHLVAAAGHISNEDFLAGVDHFTGVSGEVANAGSIRADLVELVGRYVANSGNISAPGGLILLAAGDEVLVGEPGSPLYVKLDSLADAGAPDPARAGIEQSGTLVAEGGRVSLEAGDLYGLAIHHTGSTRADDIQIAGGDTGLVEVKGTLDASSSAPDGVGGRIEVTGEKIALRDAVLDASGPAGGGTVLVGGDYQGSGDTRTAEQTFVDPDTRLRADALADGDGGKVVVWADGTTGYYGDISARGGDAGGDGGLVEVSGKDTLYFRGDVDTSAPHGAFGSLLLDPVNITIANGVGDGAADGTNTFAGVPSGATGTVTAADTAPVTIFESELEGLAATTSVSLAASSNITMQDLSDNLLALSTTGPGTVTFNAGGAFSMDQSDTIRTEGASITIVGVSTALGSLSTRGASGTANGALAVFSTGTGPLTVRGIDTGSAAVSLNTNGSILDDLNAATRINAGTLALNAGTNAAIGSLLNPIGTNLAGTLTSAKPGVGGLFVSEANGLVLGTITAGTGAVSLTAEAGSITMASGTPTIASAVLSLNAPGGAIGTTAAPIRTSGTLRLAAINAGIGNAAFNSTVGAILDDGNASTLIHANDLLLTTANGAPVGAVTAPIQTDLTGALTVLRSAPTSGAVASGGIFVTQTNDLRINAVVAPGFSSGLNPPGVFQQGIVSLTSQNGSIFNVGAGITGSNVTLTANGPLAGIGTPSAPILVNSLELIPSFVPGVGRLGPTTPWTLTASAPNGGGINVRQTQGFKLGAINAGAGTFSLTATNGRILDDGDSSTVVNARSLALSATGTFPIYSDPPNNQPNPPGTPTPTPAFIGPLTTQNVANLTATANSDIAINNHGGDDLTLGPITSANGGFQLSHDAGNIVVASAPSLSPFTSGNLGLDTPYAIDFRVPTLSVGGSILLNRNIAPEDIVEPRLATLFVTPGTTGDPSADARNLTLSAGTDVIMGQGQVLSVPGALTISASRRTTLADINALTLNVSSLRSNVYLRGPKSLFLADGSQVSDQGGNMVANQMSFQIGEGMTTTGNGTPPLFATPDGAGVSDAPNGSRFGQFATGLPLTPADFVGNTGTAIAGRVLDLLGIANTTSGSPDAVAPTPWPVDRMAVQLSLLNAAAAGDSYVRGADLLAFLRCSNAPGDDPDRVPVDCLGYSAKEERAPFGTPEAAQARAVYRQLYTEREDVQKTLGASLEVYRASGQGAASDGVAFRRFLEQDTSQVEAWDAVRRLEELMGDLDKLMGDRRAGNERLEYWRQQLLDDFTPEGMSVEQLDAAIGGPSAAVRTAGL